MKYLSIIATTLLLLALGTSCTEEPAREFEQTTRLVQNLYVNPTMTLYAGQQLAIHGVGFSQGDQIAFRADKELKLAVHTITAKTACVTIPEALSKGSYKLYLMRGEAQQFISVVKVYLTSNFDVPEKEGFNIRGILFCADRGIAGVRVSDGIVTTTTDENGYYWLASDKSTGNLFYTIPSGYRPLDFDYDAMGFWQPLTGSAEIDEQHNFSLVEAPGDRFTLLVGADLHLANKQRDIEHFKKGFVADTEAFAAAQSNPVYCLMVGDMTWDRYWYDNRYAIPEYKRLFEELRYSIPIFNTIGNHDNDPYMQGDELGQLAYRKGLGPNYYSFKLGKAHFVVLDDIDWINTKGAAGKIGDRDFNRLVSMAQMEWFKADLAAITDKSAPLIIALHAPMYDNYNAQFSNAERMSSATGGTKAILNAVAGFQNVHFLSGHSHSNATMQINDRVMEHNHAAVCETWWWSQYLSNRAICIDGAPAGYGIYHFDGNQLEWLYKGIGEPISKQFRTYDMNPVKEVLKSDKIKEMLAKYSSRTNKGDDYGKVGENVVYINVWNYDPQWSVSVTENGVARPVTRIFQRDPLHTLVFDIPRIESGGEPNSDWASCEHAHLFSVTATSATSTLEITVTDRFGNSSTETMTRPKAFVKTMQ